MNYYKEHSKEFIDSTVNCDMSEQYRFFEKYLKSKGTILDIGFGSGRDSLYFKRKGYAVYSIDPEEEFVYNAKKMGLENVYQLKVQEIEFENMFDGIWACASLLHVPSEELVDALKKCKRSLVGNGVIYVSFKYGDFEGERNGRFYLDLNEERLKHFANLAGLCVLDILISQDVRPNKTEKWLNAVLK